MKTLTLAAAALAVCGQAALAAQSSQPTKTAPVHEIRGNWSQGLNRHDTSLVNQVTQGKSEEDRWMIRTAIVRNREASRDIFAGESLTEEKVLANVRVRMTTDESQRWTRTRSHLNSWDLQAMVTVLRHDLAKKH